MILRQAPDVMVVLGRAKGDSPSETLCERGSYQQWKEDNIAPQVVFEILSPANTQTEMNKKMLFYQRYGVEEYYLYDPDKNDLSGWIFSSNNFEDSAAIDPIDNWVSPRLKVRFDLSGEELQIIRPDGERFLSYVDIAQKLKESEQRAEQAEQRAEQAEQRAVMLAEQLRALGVKTDNF